MQPRGEEAVQVVKITPTNTGTLLSGYFRPGQVVEVEVLEVRGGAALVRVEGQVFWARGEIPASPAAFPALVQKVSPEALHLKRLPPPRDVPGSHPGGPEPFGAQAGPFEAVRLCSFREGEEEGGLYLLAERRQGGGAGRPAALALFLRTPKLGETWVYLTARGDTLNLQVFAGSEKSLALFRGASGELKERLLALGFARLHLEVAAQKFRTPGELLARAAFPPYRSIDARV